MNNFLNNPGFRLLRFHILIIIAISLSFSVSVYFFRFFELPDYTKIIVVLLLFFIFLIASYLLINKNFQTIRKFLNFFRPIIVIVVFIIATSTFIITKTSLQWFPSQNSFEITILSPSAERYANSIEIYEIALLPSDDKQRKLLTTDDLELDGNWISEGDTLSVSGSGGEKLSFNDYSTNGISILLLQGPDAGEIEIKWNGKSKKVNLHEEKYNQSLLEFPYVFAWHNLSSTRVFLFLFLFLSNFISLLTILLFFTYTLSKVFIYLHTSQNVTFLQKCFIFLVLISPFLNISGFVHYQTNNLFRLAKVPSNTFASLDNSSKDNFKNFQVYLMLEQLYQGYTLIIPDTNMFLGEIRIDEDDLLVLSRLKSICRIDYNPILSKQNLDDLEIFEKKTIEQMGRIRFDYYFYQEPVSLDQTLCVWRFDNKVYFIPNSDYLTCSRK
ncbi:MAG: hypothetical protein JXA54_10790 [Candidatus Heimdallarchaeota archaeon]|nr:hypothetical protein [Candidatus Heimdallarchaeota archaeon]